MGVLEGLQPSSVFGFFEEISAIPRETFDTRRISDYCVEFARKRNLKVIQDEVNNIIIKKSGTKGYENAAPVILQGHLDMVCEKVEGSSHDFKKDGLDLFIEDGFIKARGTTLGADDGIAVAYALAVLDSEDIPHPPVEALFTVDEEVGMGGAAALNISQLNGTRLLNIDSDVEGTILAGCAGGFRQTFTLPIKREQRDGDIVTIQIGGLRGGHSGSEIDQQRGNANKMMARLLNRLNQNTELRLIDCFGGSKDNVITPSCKARIVTDNGEKVKRMIDKMAETWRTEFQEDEPDMEVTCEMSTKTAACMTKTCSDKAIFVLACTPYGVQGESRSLKGLVETSLNMGMVFTEESNFTVVYLIRSSVTSKLDEMQETLNAWAAQMEMKSEISGQYPAWMYRPDSRLRQIAADTFRQLFDREPVITTIHAGLECGILSGKKPELDCISFGPITYDIHSVHERLDIASTMRMWEFLKAMLANCRD